MSANIFIDLVQLDPSIETSLFNDSDYIDAMSNENWAQVADMTLRKIGRRLECEPLSINSHHWGGYYVIDTRTREFVGSCAYKDKPSPSGEVEIAYFTYPGFEGKGFATAMAAKLIDMAMASPLVTTVIAHTLPEENASVALLKKIGMKFGGEISDPDDGQVWRWECAKCT